MDRLTISMASNNLYFIDKAKVEQYNEGYSGEAINKLAKFENIYDDLTARQLKIGKELEELRLEDKTKSVKFKQLLAEKLTNSNILSLFKTYGL